MSILAIDYGAKKIGLAVSNDEETLAVPLRVVHNVGREQLLITLNEMCEQHSITKVIVGVPVSLSQRGDTVLRDVDLQNKQMKEVLEFISWLAAHIGLPVEMEDERLSTKMAGSLMKGEMRGEEDDAVAAMLILQNYIDKHH